MKKRRANQETGNVLALGVMCGRRQLSDVSFHRFAESGGAVLKKRRRGQPVVWNRYALGLLLQEYGRLVIPHGWMRSGLPADTARVVLAAEYGIKPAEVKRRISEARRTWRRRAQQFPDWLRPVLRPRTGGRRAY